MEGKETVERRVTDHVVAANPDRKRFPDKRDSGKQVDDDPYADFKIPDDLMW